MSWSSWGTGTAGATQLRPAAWPSSCSAPPSLDLLRDEVARLLLDRVLVEAVGVVDELVSKQVIDVAHFACIHAEVAHVRLPILRGIATPLLARLVVEFERL